MLADDREEFDRQVSILCAAFSVPMGDRGDALWRAFSRLSLAEFGRIVDAAVSPDCEIERMPTVSQLWKLRRLAKTSPVHTLPTGAQAALVEYVLANYSITHRQKSTPWNWISRNSGEMLGVIVPQDPDDPVKNPAIRVLFADADWRPMLSVA